MNMDINVAIARPMLVVVFSSLFIAATVVFTSSCNIIVDDDDDDDDDDAAVEPGSILPITRETTIPNSIMPIIRQPIHTYANFSDRLFTYFIDVDIPMAEKTAMVNELDDMKYPN